jgi:hypothetical protein
MPQLSVNDLTPLALTRLLELYHIAFEPLRARTATKQTLDDAEFRALLDLDSVSIFMAESRDHEPAAFGVMVSDLKMIPWINPEFYAVQYPEHYATGRIFYFSTLLVDPKHQKGTAFLRLTREMTRFLADHHAVVAMDCCTHNVEVERLPQLVETMCRREANLVEARQLDSQVFFGYQLTPAA